MVRQGRTLVGSIALTLVLGCAERRGTITSGTSGVRAAQGQKTIVLGPTRLDPPDLVLATSESVAFVNTGTDPLTMEFTGPKEQTGRITCRLSDPKALKKGEAPWAEFRLNEEGHYKANIPPGRFPSVCTLAPGPYTYVVHVVTAALSPSELRLGQQGTITVR